VEGDQARARWYLFMPCTLAAGNQAVWRAGVDYETYAWMDGTSLFRHKRSEPLMMCGPRTRMERHRYNSHTSRERHLLSSVCKSCRVQCSKMTSSAKANLEMCCQNLEWNETRNHSYKGRAPQKIKIKVR